MITPIFPLVCIYIYIYNHTYFVSFILGNESRTGKLRLTDGHNFQFVWNAHGHIRKKLPPQT